VLQQRIKLELSEPRRTENSNTPAQEQEPRRMKRERVGSVRAHLLDAALREVVEDLGHGDQRPGAEAPQPRVHPVRHHLHAPAGTDTPPCGELIRKMGLLINVGLLRPRRTRRGATRSRGRRRAPARGRRRPARRSERGSGSTTYHQAFGSSIHAHDWWTGVVARLLRLALSLCLREWGW
jgi:hypothetical protein